MESFAIYRLPIQNCHTGVTMIEGSPETLSEASEIDEKKGFVIAPFCVGKTTPITFIQAELIEDLHLEELSLRSKCKKIDKICENNNKVGFSEVCPNKQDYSRDFTRFHSCLTEGKFSKLVLSRKKIIKLHETKSPTKLFIEACKNYPHCFISLFSTPFSGTWLVASPELLFEKKAEKCRTVALAGTMEYSENLTRAWSDKNIKEQLYVSNYVKETISQFSEDIVIDGPKTVKAASLVHLRSDFSFILPNQHHIGEIIKELHPTPAVCGLPKKAAQDFIIKNEYSERSYYSGFCGPICINDNMTSLYVLLRCMRIRGNEFDLFAGGGLLKESIENAEWNETEAKMQPMTKLLMQ